MGIDASHARNRTCLPNGRKSSWNKSGVLESLTLEVDRFSGDRSRAYPRYGYLMLHALAKAEGLAVNRKKAYRIYQEEEGNVHHGV